MGVNFYHYDAETEEPCIGQSHIGKSSVGWCFALHVYPGEIDTLEDWLKRLYGNGYIQDDYGDEITLDALIKLITKRSAAPVPARFNGCGHLYKTRGKPMTQQEFLDKNSAVLGPNNLLRYRLGNGCIGHGDGTWDYLTGDFS